MIFPPAPERRWFNRCANIAWIAWIWLRALWPILVVIAYAALFCTRNKPVDAALLLVAGQGVFAVIKLRRWLADRPLGVRWFLLAALLTVLAAIILYVRQQAAYPGGESEFSAFLQAVVLFWAVWIPMWVAEKWPARLVRLRRAQ